jgi:hypothetical protein
LVLSSSALLRLYEVIVASIATRNHALSLPMGVLWVVQASCGTYLLNSIDALNLPCFLASGQNRKQKRRPQKRRCARFFTLKVAAFPS